MDGRIRWHSLGLLGHRYFAIAIIGSALLYYFPLFHIMPLPTVVSPEGSDMLAAADKFWTQDLPGANAANATAVAIAYQKDPVAAIRAYARTVGLGGTAYFFLKGEGIVVSCTRDAVRLSLGSDAATQIELQIGAIFGNSVRDATGLLDVNHFSSLQDYNELASELNKRVESRVLPNFRNRVYLGAHVVFTGCAEAVETPKGQQVLSIIPIKAEVH